MFLRSTWDWKSFLHKLLILGMPFLIPQPLTQSSFNYLMWDQFIVFWLTYMRVCLCKLLKLYGLLCTKGHFFFSVVYLDAFNGVYLHFICLGYDAYQFLQFPVNMGFMSISGCTWKKMMPNLGIKKFYFSPQFIFMWSIINNWDDFDVDLWNNVFSANHLYAGNHSQVWRGFLGLL